MPLPYLIAWFALAVIATVNGVVREFGYGRWMSDLGAHQLSTLIAILLVGAFTWWMQGRWPIRSSAQAWRTGAVWLGLTVLFEFGFGHFVAGYSWQRLLADYDLLEGRVWVLFLLWLLLAPRVMLGQARR